MHYMTIAEASKKWNISRRQVQRLVAQNRIPGAKKFGRAWMLPMTLEKPADLRSNKGEGSLASDLRYVVDAASHPMPGHNPDAVFETLNEDVLHLIYEAELSYLRGDFLRTMQCCEKAGGNDAAKLRTCPFAIAAAISLGDYRAYTEIKRYLKDIIETNKGSEIAAFADISLATAAVSVLAPNMAPDWLKAGDLSMIPHRARPIVIYLRVKYFQCVGQYETMLAVAQTALTLCFPDGFSTIALYLRICCAVACNTLGRREEAIRWLKDAMRFALPHGFVTPFAEVVTVLSGLVEQCLKQEFPDYYDTVIEQWKRTWKNWITFHNQFTNDNITLMLSLREYHIAQMVARRIPYAKIAEQYCISVGRLKNIMLEIYEKLFISGRDELVKYIL